MSVVSMIQPGIKKSAFDQFWEIYPRHVAKADSLREWEKLSESDKLLALSTISAHARYWRSKGYEPEFIPHARKWLHTRRFEDELENVTATVVEKCCKCGRTLHGHTVTRDGKMCNDCWRDR